MRATSGRGWVHCTSKAPRLPTGAHQYGWRKASNIALSFVRSMSRFYLSYVALCLLPAAGDATVRAFEQFEDGGGNVAQGEDGICPSQFDRLAGHPPYDACFLVLHHCNSAGVVHGFQTVCPITPHTGEQDANSIVPSVLGDRAKQDVHRRSVTIDWRAV